MLRQIAAIQICRHRSLGQGRRLKIAGFLDGRQLGYNCLRRDQPPQPQRRSQNLGERADVEHVTVIIGAYRRQTAAVVAQEAIGIILDDRQSVGGGNLGQPQALLLRHADAKRVVGVGDDVQVRRNGPPFQVINDLIDLDARFQVCSHRQHLRSIGGDRLTNARVNEFLQQHLAGGIQQEPGQDVKRLLSAGRQEYLLRRARYPALGHKPNDMILQGCERRAVL